MPYPDPNTAGLQGRDLADTILPVSGPQAITPTTLAAAGEQEADSAGARIIRGGIANPAIMKAIWKDTVLAESDATRVVEGNHYFPPESLKRQYFQESDHHTTCGWKGVASYHHVKVDDEINRDACWYYPEPKPAAEEIRGYYAFWKGVKVEP